MHSRIYIASPYFGIDLSPDWIRLDPIARNMDRMEFPGDRTVSNSFDRFSHFDFNISFSMPSMMEYRPRWTENKWDSPILLLDKEIPKLPDRPIWLPPKEWECSYCSTTQKEYLLQCRSCGAPRIGEDAKHWWGVQR